MYAHKIVGSYLRHLTLVFCSRVFAYQAKFCWLPQLLRYLWVIWCQEIVLDLEGLAKGSNGFGIELLTVV